MFTAILNVIRGYRTTFNDFEIAILNAVSDALPAHLHRPFAKRVAEINCIQPLLGGLEINLYHRRKGEIRFSESGRILASDASTKIATVHIDSADELTRLRCTVFCGRGVLTSLEFNEPSEHASIDHVRSITARVVTDTPWA